MDTMQVLWLVLLVLFLILEASTAALVSVWFAAGALVALLVALFAPNAVVAQGVIFVLVSVAALLAIRPLARGLIGNRHVPTNADAAIGKSAQVISEVQPSRFGRVNLEGQVWTARSDYVLPVGTWCRVEAIEGVKLVVLPFAPSQQEP